MPPAGTKRLDVLQQFLFNDGLRTPLATIGGMGARMTAVHGGGLQVVRDDPQQSLFSDMNTFSVLDIGNRIADVRLFGAYRQETKLFELKPVDAALDEGIALPRRRFVAAPVEALIYDRLMPKAEPEDLPDLAAVEALGHAMMDGTGVPTVADGIPAAYTYLGQFIAHDISKMVQRETDGKFYNWRTPALDLDSLFGPVDRHLSPAPDVYSAAGLMLGRTSGTKAPLYDDLPRTKIGEAVIPDARNDQNLAVAQLHVAITKFHQTVSLLFPDKTAEEWRLLTTRHFHSLVLFDYLRRIVDPAVFADVMTNGRAVVHPQPVSDNDPFLIPVEFAAACFRFGHSMVRGAYTPWSRQRATVTFGELVQHTHLGGSLVEGRYLGADWVVDWSGLIGIGLDHDRVMAAAIDTNLTQGLFDLRRRQGLLPEKTEADRLASANLAARTMVRGHGLCIRTAQAAIDFIGSRVKGLSTLSDDELLDVSNPRVKQTLTAGDFGKRLQNRTPLWFYVLREAEHFHAGKHLGPLASRLVMETIHAAIQATPGGIIAGDNSVDFTAEERLGGWPGRAFYLRDMLACVERHWHP